MSAPTSTPESTASCRRRACGWLAALAVLGALGLAALAIWGPGREMLEWARGHGAEILAWVRARGPLAFYAAFVVAGTLGAPASIFTVGGAAAFGTAVGYLGGLVGISGCICLSHVLARVLFRKPLAAIMGRLGYRIPEIPEKRQLAFILFFRITPGLPFPLQNYLLPLAGVPLRRNLLVSLPPQMLVLAGLVFLGGSVFSGSAGKAVWGVMLIAGAMLLFAALRKRRSDPAAAEGRAPGVADRQGGGR